MSSFEKVPGQLCEVLSPRARTGYEEVKPCPRERVGNRRPLQKEDTFHNVANQEALRAKLLMIIP